MSACWKCGKELTEGQVECEYGCGQDTITDEQIKEAFRRQAALTASIDWDKLKTIEDLREFLRCCYGDRIYFPLGIPDAVKKFLKSQGDSQSKEGK